MAYTKPVLLAGNLAHRRILAMCPSKMTCFHSCQEKA
jgi:hypothetical protein